MKQRLLTIASMVLLGALFLIGCHDLDLREDEASIEEDLLEATPLGSSLDQVLRNIEGATHQDVVVSRPLSELPLQGLPFETRPWAAYLRWDLGGYGSGLQRVDVTAYYVFDSDEELVEVTVVKFFEGT